MRNKDHKFLGFGHGSDTTSSSSSAEEIRWKKREKELRAQIARENGGYGGQQSSGGWFW